MNNIKNDFDDWDDYESPDISLLQKNELNDPDAVILRRDSKMNIFGMSEDEWIDNFFESHYDVDYEDNEYVKLKRVDEFEWDGQEIELFEPKGDTDFFLLRKDEDLHFFYVYQPNNYYQDDNKLTFTGWDDNTIVDMKTMKFKKQNVR